MPLTGYGITIAWESSFLAGIRDCTPPEMTREEIDTTHTTTADGYMTYMMSDLIDSGELSVDIIFEPDAEPPIDQDFSSAVITFSDGTTWTGSMAMKSYAPTAPIDEMCTATCVLKVSGKITIA